MYIVFLKFAAARSEAGQWMAGHRAWIQAGLDAGAFLLTGSLANGVGGALLAVAQDEAALWERLRADPFVVHGVVNAEVHAVTPSGMAPALAGLPGLARGGAA